ncbi:hypothetical protein L1280_003107 [Deinococcus sp. HSC-46F16]|uniref:hypothetical protein n=1 Tax=Deinococcus sp. HSC-46F16 TaxID=2910968 RepID=UPI0020A13098|nr:hypothetical protein [Deinococcus sp. HSC-46F16]MCP2015924.1 hypothetical protein [Deinococcus sp. HSC-46F16]
MSSPTDHRIATAQQLLGTLNSLSGMGVQLASRLATEEDRRHFLEEAQRGAIQKVLEAAQSAVAVNPDAPAEVDSPDLQVQDVRPRADGPPSGNVDLVSLGVGMFTGGAGGAVTAQAALAAAQHISEAFVDYAKTAQVEATKRAHIDAWRQATVEQITSTRRVMEIYLERTFDERRENFDRMFDALDAAQERGDLKGMQLMLSGILDLAKSSPFKDLAEFQQQLNNPDFVLEL